LATFVLVHGAWHGAWCWRRVSPLLRAAGHDVHAVTLTGLGERAHLLSREVRLATHIADVVGVIVAEELADAILVGHSYGGIVITGTADRLQRERPGALQQLVYVDGTQPLPGQSWSSAHAPEVVAARVAAAEKSGGVSLPVPDAAFFGITDPADREWVNRRMTPHPFGPYLDALDYDRARVDALPRTFIDCTEPAFANIAPMRRRVRTEPGWKVVEIATGHDAMVTAPRELADALLDCVAGS
jgi:pimeloyl-ACP methyl ester carboxylesterase